MNKLKCNYVRALLDALLWAEEQGPKCLASLLENLDYLDQLPQWESVVRVSIGPGPYRPMEGEPPGLSWAGYSADDGRPWQERQVIHGGLNYSRASGEWSVNT